MKAAQTLTLIRPDDCHLHLRDGAYLATTAPDAAKQFARAIIMPNLKPPITTVAQAEAYRTRILSALPKNSNFTPFMTLYLTDTTSLTTIHEAARSPFIIGVKLYPAGATTHSEAGVTSLEKLYPLFAEMEKVDLPLLIHGESTDPAIDIFDREKYFIEQELVPLARQFPNLRIVLEHITTSDAVNFISAASSTLAATITAHHLLLNRNDLFKGGIRPHLYCLPIIKRRRHQEALIQAAISGNPKFFLGTDSAPHAVQQKESACGCAGIYTAHTALELYAHVFEERNALHRLEAFASRFGAAFYRLPTNTETVQLRQESQRVPELLEYGEEELKPFMAGETLRWKPSP